MAMREGITLLSNKYKSIDEFPKYLHLFRVEELNKEQYVISEVYFDELDIAIEYAKEHFKNWIIKVVPNDLDWMSDPEGRDYFVNNSDFPYKLYSIVEKNE